MHVDRIQILCALAAFTIPLGVAWAVVTLAERRRQHGERSGKPPR